MVIVSFSLDDATLARLDAVAGCRHYGSRSGAVREALRDFIDAAEWSGEGGRASVILAVPYERASPRGDRAALQHRFGEVRTMLHTHLDERTCLQIFVAEGATARLKEFVARIRRVKGVRHIRFIQSAAE